MKYKPLLYFVLTLLSVALGTSCGIYHCYVSMGGFLTFGLFLSYLLFKLYGQYPRKMKLMLESLENEDTMFQFSEHKSDLYQREFSKYLNEIKNIIQREKMEVRAREKYFEVLMDNVVTGIVTLDSKGYVVDINDRALKLLGLEVFTHISQYERLDASVFNRLSVNSTKVMLNSTEMTLYAINDIQDELEEKEQDSWKKLIRVLTHEIMNTITPISSLSDTLRDLGQQNFEANSAKNEESKTKLNAVSDIETNTESNLELNAASDIKTNTVLNVKSDVELDVQSRIESNVELKVESDVALKTKQNNAKIYEGLSVISSTSKGLIAFVDSYRMITKEPVPIKHAVLVRELFNQVCVLEQEEIECNKAEQNKAEWNKVEYDKVGEHIIGQNKAEQNKAGQNVGALNVELLVDLKNQELMIYADEHQIVQVLINLVKNAIDAEATKITLSAIEDQTTEDIYIEVTNNGKRIPDEDASHIFVPFFTTKKHGNGIGLSLSSRIMLLHSGRLRLISSTEQETKFVLIFR